MKSEKATDLMFTKYLDPKNAGAFKKIFGMAQHKNISIAFLNAVFHLEGPDQILDLEFIDTAQSPEIAAQKESVVDVLVKDQRGDRYQGFFIKLLLRLIRRLDPNIPHSSPPSSFYFPNLEHFSPALAA